MKTILAVLLSAVFAPLASATPRDDAEFRRHAQIEQRLIGNGYTYALRPSVSYNEDGGESYHPGADTYTKIFTASNSEGARAAKVMFFYMEGGGWTMMVLEHPSDLVIEYPIIAGPETYGERGLARLDARIQELVSR